jgi:hypothetical protein
MTIYLMHLECHCNFINDRHCVDYYDFSSLAHGITIRDKVGVILGLYHRQLCAFCKCLYPSFAGLDIWKVIGAVPSACI